MTFSAVEALLLAPALAAMLLQGVASETEITAADAGASVFLAAASARMSCSSGLRTFDPRQHKNIYRVGVHAIRGFDAAFQEYNQTFGEYLTATAGHRFDFPIRFEMVPVTTQGLFDAVDEEEIDFFFANPGVYSCVGVELGANPLATIVSRLTVRGHTFELDVFGGVIATRAENDDINSIVDLKDKVIGAGAISQIMAAQLQFYEMERAGMSYIMDPKQVVFTGNQFDVVKGVLNGDFDVGFIRTDTIERTIGEDGKAIDPDLLKVISPQIYVLDDGNLFPFLHSTDIYPEWPVASLKHVNRDVQEEVQAALLAVGRHSALGQKLEECNREYGNHSTCDTFPFPEYFDPNGRCDSSRELCKIAWQASKAGSWAGFRTSRSYFEPRTMHEAAGFMLQDKRGNWKCTRAETLYDGIHCPAEHYKLSRREFDSACADQALPCKDGYDCYCKPCVKAFEVNVYEYVIGTRDAHIDGFEGENRTGCDKMSICGTVPQTKTITFRAFDNQEREGAAVTVKMHIEDTTEELPVRRINGTFVYEFDWAETHTGVGIMEVFVDGKQIPESPLRVAVEPRHCDVDYPGQGKIPDSSGECMCGGSTIDLFGKCVSSALFFVIIAIILILVVLELGWWYLVFKKKQSDQLWLVSVEELHFDDPVEIIGQGAFGVVLKAEYRGTTVAIKRVLSAGEKRSVPRSTTSTGSGEFRSISMDSGPVAGERSADSGSVDLEVQSASGQGSGGTADSDNGDSNEPGQRSLGIRSITSSCSGAGAAFGEELDFLGDGIGGQRRSTWSIMFPCLFSDHSSQDRIKNSVLGGASGTTSQTGLVGNCCPWFDHTRRQKIEFMKEMRLLSRLRHPCITTVMGAVVSTGYEPMLVMEYCEYGSLHDLLRNETMYTGGDIILQIVRDISQGLHFLHASKPAILHGDLKAKNIMIDSRFRAKVGDFGLSQKQKHGLSGTPYWMAPEYLRGKTDFNPTCDIYSVGIIMYEIYSRNVPYEGENSRHVLRKVCDPRVNKRPSVPDCCPQKMVDVMKKCWSPDAFFRPTAKDLDLLFMDMGAQDSEPLAEGQRRGCAVAAPRTEDMLYRVFPRHIADALKNGEKVEPEQHDLVTIIFSDIVHFTDISSSISPIKVSNMLDRLYLAFDNLAGKHNVFKVETIGDAYMGVTNLNNKAENTHVKDIAEFAIEAVEAAGKILIDEDDPKRGYVRIRVGFHSGPVVSNVIGSLNPRYGLFGDSVNVASRMESNSMSRRIQCSDKSAKLLKEQARHVTLTKRGKIGVKGKGGMVTYWVGDTVKSGPKQDGKPQMKHAELKAGAA